MLNITSLVDDGPGDGTASEFSDEGKLITVNGFIRYGSAQIRSNLKRSSSDIYDITHISLQSSVSCTREDSFPLSSNKENDMPRTTIQPQQNYLLASLPAKVQDRLFPHLEHIPLPLGKTLYESGYTMRYVYFPTDSIVSLLNVMADGVSAEISMVGNEGIVGISLFMGGESTPSRAVVLCLPLVGITAQGRV